jgi:hypothetical protein
VLAEGGRIKARTYAFFFNAPMWSKGERMTHYVDDKYLRFMANSVNFRGVKTDRLVYDLQDVRDKLDLCDSDVEIAIAFARPSDCPQDEWISSHRTYWKETESSIEAELVRRRNLSYVYSRQPDTEICQVIKDSLKVEDVLEWYVEVIVPRGKSGGDWRFRCRQHGDGQDTDPSGVLYRNEQRWWCYGCGTGGTVIDAVMHFEHLDLNHAIALLARNLGSDAKMLIRPVKVNEIETIKNIETRDSV